VYTSGDECVEERRHVEERKREKLTYPKDSATEEVA
jgi:hypothetical protein